VVCWGGSPVNSEQTPGGDVVASLELQRHHGYRAVPLLPGQVSADALRRGMTEMTARRLRRSG
jgi:hypothetical protein